MSSLHYSPEQRAVELGQLLQRLELSLLHADETREKSLRRNEFERARLQQNLAYGFSIFTTLQNTDSSMYAPSQRQTFQNDLLHKADLLDLLQDRLRYLNDLAAHDDGSDSADENSEWTDDDVFGGIVPTPSESTDSQPLKETPDIPPPVAQPKEPEPVIAVVQPKPATVTAQSLRPRNKRTQSAATTQPTAAATAPPASTFTSAHTTARSALFASRKANLSAPQTSNATAEAILDHQRSEQNALSESILQMAAALKASSQRFSDTLDQDKDSLNRATDGITKTEESMDAAGRRMTMLRRMTEGKGWWGRMILFAWVYGLMVALILLVFVLPKLRF